MRVLQINATYGLGSTGTIVRDIRQCSEANGIESFVAYAYTNEVIERGYKIGNKFSNTLHALLSRISGKQAYFSYLPTVRFLKYISRIKPDVVHLHNLHSNYINLPMLLKYLAKHDIKTLITLHDCWWFTGGCFHYASSGCEKWMEKCGDCSQRINNTPAYFCDKSSDILTDRKNLLLAIPRLIIVGVSRWISNEARKSFLITKQVETIYNGIDLTIFKPTASNLRKRLDLTHKYVILGPASKWLDPINKEVLDYFVKNMKNDEVLLLFGAEKSDITLPHNVKLYGYTYDKRELAALYAMADVFVNVSREDTLSTINIEAQACGTPVVSFDNTSMKETIYENSGRVINSDIAALFKAASTIGNTYNACRVSEYIQNNFTKENYQHYIQLYLER